jgi:pyrimidine and pyridine-specific 5'-nucleotidase
MQICGVSDPSKHYFVDDSLLNVRGAKKEGWNSFLFDEDGSYQGKYQEGEIDGVVSRLQGKA